MNKLMFQGIALIICVFSASAATVDFETQIQPIFTSNCVRCHGGAAGLSLEKGVSYNNLVGVVSHNYSPAVRVKPGDLANSVLFNKVNDTGVYGGVMPKDTGKMSEAYIDLIASWIAPTPVPTASFLQFVVARSAARSASYSPRLSAWPMTAFGKSPCLDKT